MRLADFGVESVLHQCAGDPVLQIGRVCRVGDMLKLAAAAFREMPARRRLVVGTWLDGTVLPEQIARRRRGWRPPEPATS